MLNLYLKVGMVLFVLNLPMLFIGTYFPFDGIKFLEIVWLAALVLGLCKYYRRLNDGVVQLSKLVRFNYRSGALLGFWCAAWYLLIFNIVSPGLWEETLNVMRNAMKEDGFSNEEEEALRIFDREFRQPIFQIIYNVFFYSLIFTIVSFIVGVFMKRPRQIKN